MQGSVLRSKEMSVLDNPAGGDSGDEMMDVMVVGMGSVGKKWINRTTEGWPAR